jgi:hypothetical protein
LRRIHAVSAKSQTGCGAVCVDIGEFGAAKKRPCTLQVPQWSRQIFSCKPMAVGSQVLSRNSALAVRCSLQDAVHQYQGEPKRENTDGYTHQHEKRPSHLQRSSLSRALILFRGSRTIDWVGRDRQACDPTSVKIQKSHGQLSDLSPGAVYMS